MSNIKDVKEVDPRLDPTLVQLGGKLRRLQFDLNAFGELENKFGTIQKAMEQLQKGRMADVKIILWAALIHEEAVLDPITGDVVSYNITPYQVASWVKTPKLLKEVSEKLGVAMGGDMPEPENLAIANINAVEDASQVAPEAQIATIVPTAEEQELEAKNG